MAAVERSRIMTFPQAHHCNAHLQVLLRRTRADDFLHNTQQPKKIPSPFDLSSAAAFSSGVHNEARACSTSSAGAQNHSHGAGYL